MSRSHVADVFGVGISPDASELFNEQALVS